MPVKKGSTIWDGFKAPDMRTEDTIPAKRVIEIEKEHQEAVRMAKLPAWAQMRIIQAEREATRLKALMDEMRGDALTGSPFSYHDLRDSGGLGKRMYLPKRITSFSAWYDEEEGSIEFSADEGRKRVIARTNHGIIIVRPEAANVVSLALERW